MVINFIQNYNNKRCNEMLKHKIFLSIFVFFFLSVCCSQNIVAAESEKNLGDSKLGNIAKIIKPADVSTSDFKKIRKVAVLITSTLPLFGGVAEDQLAIKLRDKGFDVIESSKVSEATQKELIREELKNLETRLDLERQLGKPGEKSIDQKITEKQIEQLKEASTKKGILLEIGKKLGLDAAIIGTLFEGRRQIGFSDDNPPLSMEKIVVSTFYLQVIDIKTEKVILSVILEYDKGESITKAIDTMTEKIIEEMKG